MKIVIAGGSGFLGRPLADTLLHDGHEVIVLSRTPDARVAPGARAAAWTPGGTGPWVSHIDGAGVVVNLAGESIGGRRWSAARKQRIDVSRIDATRSLVEAIGAAEVPPPVFVSGSAVGFYGPCGDEVVTEDSRPGNDFLAHVCRHWEAEAMAASTPRTRVVCVRSGLVLERDGGALPQMLPPFRFGVGGPVGSGRQYWPWIHRQDWIDLVLFALRTPSLSGPVNATAPAPVTNAEFARALGRALRRPALIPAPAPALRLLLGEMAGPLLLSGQRAVPARAERHGFTFRFREIDAALAALFQR